MAGADISDSVSGRSELRGTRMTKPTWPPRPPDRIRHSWRCTRRAVIVETVRAGETGRSHVVALCVECDGTDLAERLRAEAPEQKPA
jgi:hypothetical protein